MKKILAFVLASAMVLSMAACGNKASDETTTAEVTTTTAEDTVADTVEDTEESSSEEDYDFGAMSYEDYCNAEIDAEVSVLCYVQATQSWWEDKITVYAADKDGAYFIYEMSCTEEEAATLVPGACILVSGYKSEWAGEVEIADATFVPVEDLGDSYVAEVVDATDKLGDEEALLALQNQLVAFSGMTVESVAFKNEEPGDDIYVTLSKDEKTYEFCLEYYLNGSDEEFYTAVSNLAQGDVVDVEGFLYWYNGPNTHLTKVTVQ